MAETLFTKIAEGKIPSVKLYEDNICFVILDINPIVKGHALVIAREPYPNMASTPESVLEHMILIARKVDGKLREQLHCDGTNVLSTTTGHRVRRYLICTSMSFPVLRMTEDVSALSTIHMQTERWPKWDGGSSYSELPVLQHPHRRCLLLHNMPQVRKSPPHLRCMQILLSPVPLRMQGDRG